jgi:hypothetical protein
MVAHWQVPEQRIVGLVSLMRLLAAAVRFKEEAGVIDVVENEYPPSTLPAAKPVSNKLEDIGFGVISTSNLDQTCDLSHTLFEPRRIARMYP